MNARSTPVERAHGGLTGPFQHAPDLYGGPSAPARRADGSGVKGGGDAPTPQFPG